VVIPRIFAGAGVGAVLQLGVCRWQLCVLRTSGLTTHRPAAPATPAIVRLQLIFVVASLLLSFFVLAILCFLLPVITGRGVLSALGVGAEGADGTALIVGVAVLEALLIVVAVVFQPGSPQALGSQLLVLLSAAGFGFAVMFAVPFMLLLGMHTFFAIPWKLSLAQAPVFVPFSWTRGLGVGFALTWYLSGEQRSVRTLLRRHGPLNLQVHAAMWQKLVYYVHRGLMSLASAHAVGVAIAMILPSYCPMMRALVMRFALTWRSPFIAAVCSTTQPSAALTFCDKKSWRSDRR
jgi:hypothetical protein